MPAAIRRRWLPVWAWILAGVWAGGVAILAGSAANGGPKTVTCGFRRLTGLPCPGCGTTRGVLALLAGHPVEAWLCNPLMITLLTVGGALLAAGWLFGIWPPSPRTAGPWRWLVPAGLAVLGANWAYLLIRGL